MDHLDRAGARAANADEPCGDELHPQARRCRDAARGVAFETATARMFTQQPGNYGTYVDDMVDDSAWESDDDLDAHVRAPQRATPMAAGAPALLRLGRCCRSCWARWAAWCRRSTRWSSASPTSITTSPRAARCRWRRSRRNRRRQREAELRRDLHRRDARSTMWTKCCAWNTAPSC